MGKYGKKSRVISLSWNFLDELEYTEFNGGSHFFYFQQETNFFGKFRPQNQNTSLSWSLVSRLI